MEILRIKFRERLLHLRLPVFVFIALLFSVALFSACSAASPTRNVTTGGTLGLPDYQENLDVSKALLNPDDVKEFFNSTSFSISQDLKNSSRVGYNAKYPTEQVEHTSDFSKGFLSQIEVYKAEKDASNVFNSLVDAQKNKKAEALNIKNLADETAAYKGGILTSEGTELTGKEYALFIKGKSIVVSIILRTDNNISTDQLEKLGELVLSRLSK